jgi:hypothetical protein
MIVKEFGKVFGVCDVCDTETPKFSEWENCICYLHKNNWKATRNKRTGEWENTCPECQKIKEF